MKKISIARAICTTSVAFALAVGAPLAASAHVHVDPDQAAAGSYSTLTFKVPTESATASTVKLEVDLPTDTPFGSVSYEPVAGWTTEVTSSTLATPVKTDDGTVTEAPTKITWTATGAPAAIAPGQFLTFAISAGPIPSTGSIVLPTHQTYSDGSVVDWAEPTPASGVEPENPAPTVYVNDAPPVAAASSGAGAGASVTATASPGAAGAVMTQGAGTTAAAATGDGTSALAIGLGIAGLALGAIALVVAVLAVTKKRGANVA
ncbi:YcnI family protein [Subtercola sp. RTI3]|uniref:YcnI family copper-binding membrane protein n=1 Tax=Subtercola sp. RTI3 TaxID=3048639 RepID=UPI002B22F66B|nr:YcnI family protein [Subtercola sp. RTI3]MEA9985934.1 YcnI family protein [Subtercola sp. RTI3]